MDWTTDASNNWTGLWTWIAELISQELQPIREWTDHMSVIARTMAAVTSYHDCSTKMDVAQVWFAQHSKI